MKEVLVSVSRLQDEADRRPAQSAMAGRGSRARQRRWPRCPTAAARRRRGLRREGADRRQRSSGAASGGEADRLHAGPLRHGAAGARLLHAGVSAGGRDPSRRRSRRRRSKRFRADHLAAPSTGGRRSSSSLSDNLRTLDGNAAFLYGVNLVVAARTWRLPADLPRRARVPRAALRAADRGRSKRCDVANAKKGASRRPFAVAGRRRLLRLDAFRVLR